MRLLLFYVFLILIIFAYAKTNPQNKLQDFKKKNNQGKRKNNINNSSDTRSSGNQNKNQTTKSNTYKESQLKILNDLQPLFGLRKQDQNGQVFNKKIALNLEQSNQTQKGTGIGSDDEQLILIWDQQLGNFEPEFTLTFDLPSGSIEIFYEDILQPTNIKGAFFISQIQREERIDFFIKSSNNTLIYSKEKVIEAIFNIDILEKGEYKFIFQNKRTKGTQTITFTLDVHDSVQEFLKIEDLDPLEQRIERIQMAMRDNYYFDKMTGQKFESNLREVQNSNENLFIFSIIEIVGMILITLWQVFYLKRIINNQRIF
ncbi:unnamed protein product [Paramecium primaurelia]|uniref:GOLD domain-containing protein n=1 Tax=Paramecium primaurelia TaxID=5886 RepID=A0A8S1P639_PARPR|nr:unnamed protein product [Paramecium primaurelia]